MPNPASPARIRQLEAGSGVETGAVRDHEEAAAGDAEFADNAGVGAFQNLPDSTFGFAIGPGPRNMCDGAITVHEAASGVARDEDIALNAGNRMIGNEKPVAIAMNAEAARHELATVAG